MKTIKFIPLRRVKKTGKIVVSTDSQWNKVRSADEIYGLDLILISDLSKLDPNKRVYNHKGELLFWYNHKNPDSLRMLTIADIKQSMDENGFDSSVIDGEEYKLKSMEEKLHWSVKGFDCNGTPVFSHYTIDYIGQQNMEVKDFEILTVGTVLKWYGWFIYNLKNSKITYQ